MALTAQASASSDYSNRFNALVDGLPSGILKNRLSVCSSEPLRVSEFSISHRGAPLGYPEHTQEGYLAAIEMGAGSIECDVVLTKDKQLVCRHSQCDLHRTTNILQTDLSGSCVEPFEPWKLGSQASAKCCASDITLSEFKSLCGRADNIDLKAGSIDEYLKDRSTMGTINQVGCGTLLSHQESISLIGKHGRKYIPELKKMDAVSLRTMNLSLEGYADLLLEEYRKIEIEPSKVFLQSFDRRVVDHWLARYPDYASNVVYLDGRGRNPLFLPSRRDMDKLFQQGLRYIAPPIPMLLKQNDEGNLRETAYARYANQSGLKLITWTMESRLSDIAGFSTQESDRLRVLDALAQRAKVFGVFSDWPATVTRYANCLGL